MPTFTYKGLKADGKVADGKLDAPGRPDALRQMEALGLRPVNLAELAGAAKNGSASKGSLNLPGGLEGLGKISFKIGGHKVSAKELENFTRLLSSLLAAGVPLSRALVILTKEASSPVAQAKWKEIHDLVVDGMSLADAMA
ncbi:MAG: type II secretion system F family protein, partial [Limisphaerales bacterium]